MRFFDLHCDTITKCCDEGEDLARNDTRHISLERGQCLDAWGQVFAIWIRDHMRGADAWQYFEKIYTFYRQCDLHFCTSPADIEDAFARGKCASVLSIEGGAVLMGEMARLADIYEKGVRLITLTWNGENELAFGCQAGDGHLKPFGREVVREMARLRMIVDVSHLNETGFYDVLETTDRPVLASHSTSAAMLLQMRAPGEARDFVVRRALTDAQVTALREHGGLIGLNLYHKFLGDEGNNGKEALLRHIDHLLSLTGEDFLAIGSDFDGCGIHPEMAGIEKMPFLYTYLAENGLGKPLCDKIFFDNALQFMKNML